MTLPADYGHISLPLTAHLAANPVDAGLDQPLLAARRCGPPLPPAEDLDTRNILHAADIWYSVKKHWCLEAQRLIRAKRRLVGCTGLQTRGQQTQG